MQKFLNLPYLGHKTIKSQSQDSSLGSYGSKVHSLQKHQKQCHALHTHTHIYSLLKGKLEGYASNSSQQLPLGGEIRRERGWNWGEKKTFYQQCSGKV